MDLFELNLKELGFHSTENPLKKLINAIKPNPMILDESRCPKGQADYIREWKKRYVREKEKDNSPDSQDIIETSGEETDSSDSSRS